MYIRLVHNEARLALSKKYVVIASYLSDCQQAPPLALLHVQGTGRENWMQVEACTTRMKCALCSQTGAPLPAVVHT